MAVFPKDKNSVIEDIKHFTVGTWHQYDILLASRGYGWDTMKTWADYVIEADLDFISQVTTGKIGGQSADVTGSFLENGNKCSKTPELCVEKSSLSIAGISKTLRTPMKIVWFNQTRILRLFTTIDNEPTLTQYAEMLINKTFGTENLLATDDKSIANTDTSIQFTEKSAHDKKKSMPSEEVSQQGKSIYSKIKKYVVTSYLLVAGIVLSSIQFFSSFFLLGLNIGVFSLIIMSANILFWTCLIIYYVKFRYFLSTYRLLKEKSKEDYLGDLDISNKKSSAFCGERVVFFKKTLAIIPYDEITCVYPHETGINIHLKNNKKYHLPNINILVFKKLSFILEYYNSAIVCRKSRKEVFETHPEFFKKENITKNIVGYVLIAIGIALFLIGIIRKTLETGNIIVLSTILLTGIILAIYTPISRTLKKVYKELSIYLQQSPTANRIFKISFPVSLCSILGFLIFAYTRIYALATVFIIFYGITIVPFLLSIFFKTGALYEQKPVTIEGERIYINSQAYRKRKQTNKINEPFKYVYAIPLKEKEPKIWLYDDNKKSVCYTLQTKSDEDFTGKFFMVAVCLGTYGEKAIPAVQVDGFISDTSKQREMAPQDIAYRMEIHFLRSGGKDAKELANSLRGQDLVPKALKYPGYTTPTNVRLVGICPECKKSFAFHGYAFYMLQNDVAYSDDGLDCCQINSYDFDKTTWSYETEGKTFRYYNTFNCPHCGTPYIDYKKYPENKVLGVSGCVHLGKKSYSETI